MHHPTDRIAHTKAFVTPVMEHWLEQETTQRVHHEGSIRQPISLSTGERNLNTVCASTFKILLSMIAVGVWYYGLLESAPCSIIH